MLTSNIPSPVFNTVLAAFIVVVLLGIVLGAYAATELRKAQERVAELTAAAEPAATKVASGDADED